VMLYQLSHIRRLRSNFSKTIAGSDTGIGNRLVDAGTECRHRGDLA